MLLPYDPVVDVKPLTEAYVLADVIAKWQLQVQLQVTSYKQVTVTSGSKQVTANRTSTNNQKKSYIVVPYYSGLSESIKNIGRKFGNFKGATAIKNLLMTPKDKDPI